MKLVPYYIICLLAVLLQITLLGGDFSLNLILAAIVISTVYLRASDVLPIALICGLLLDLHAGTFFGFNLLFFVFAALVAKFVLHLGERSTGYWSVVVTLGILEVLYLFMQLVFIFSVDKYTQLPTYFTRVIWQLGLTFVVGSLLYAGSIWWQSYLGRSDTKKHWVWGK